MKQQDLKSQSGAKKTDMSERIEQLREAGLKAVNRLSAERGLLITQFYKELSAAQYSIPVQRALAFE